MKKYLYIFLAASFLLLSACRASDPDTKSTAEEVPTAEITATETYESNITEPAALLLPLPQENTEFSFLSGAGGWRTIMTLNPDGSFTGRYSDSEMGDIGEEYPHGSVYICDFSGKFENPEMLNDFSYAMTLAELTTERPAGEEWIEDSIRYVASDPFGLVDPIENRECTDFILYLPETPVDQVPEDFLIWWPYRYSEGSEARTTLSCYGILNVATGYGFFTAA